MSHLISQINKSIQRAQISLVKAAHYSYIAQISDLESAWWSRSPKNFIQLFLVSLQSYSENFMKIRFNAHDSLSRVRPRKVATDLATGNWAFFHALQVTRTHSWRPLSLQNVRRVIQYLPDQNKHVDTERLYEN